MGTIVRTVVSLIFGHPEYTITMCVAISVRSWLYVIDRFARRWVAPVGV